MFQLQNVKIDSASRSGEGICIADTWYNGQKGQKLGVNKDDTVSFQFTQDGKRNNIVPGSLQVIQKGKFSGGGGGGSYQKKGSYGGNKGGYQKDDAGMTAGAAVNQACLLIAHGAVAVNKGDLINTVEKLSTQLANVSVNLKAKLKNQLAGGAGQQTNSAAQVAAAPTPVQAQAQPAPQAVSPSAQTASQGGSSTAVVQQSNNDLDNSIPF